MPTTLFVETEPAGCPVQFSGPTADLTYFISFAFAMRFGADHELAAAAQVLQRRHKVDLRPLVTFADAEPDDELSRQELARAWQDAGRLADAAQAAVAAFASDERFRDVLATYPDLVPRMAELAEIARWAAAQGGKVRITFKIA
jgi:hypothetical protein